MVNNPTTQDGLNANPFDRPTDCEGSLYKFIADNLPALCAELAEIQNTGNVPEQCVIRNLAKGSRLGLMEIENAVRYAAVDFIGATNAGSDGHHSLDIEKIMAENENLRTMLSQKIIDQTLLTNLVGDQKGWHFGLEGGACELMANSFARQLIESDAINYIEMSFWSKGLLPGEKIIVTIQKCSGMTPHQLRRQAEEKLNNYILNGHGNAMPETM